MNDRNLTIFISPKCFQVSICWFYLSEVKLKLDVKSSFYMTNKSVCWFVDVLGLLLYPFCLQHDIGECICPSFKRIPMMQWGFLVCACTYWWKNSDIYRQLSRQWLPAITWGLVYTIPQSSFDFLAWSLNEHAMTKNRQLRKEGCLDNYSSPLDTCTTMINTTTQADWQKDVVECGDTLSAFKGLNKQLPNPEPCNVKTVATPWYVWEQMTVGKGKIAIKLAWASIWCGTAFPSSRFNRMNLHLIAIEKND